MSFEELICGLSNDKHFIKNPIKLKRCIHSVCRNCLRRHNKVNIECILCGIESEKDGLKYDDVCMEYVKKFNLSLSQLFIVLENRMSSQLEIIKGKNI